MNGYKSLCNDEVYINSPGNLRVGKIAITTPKEKSVTWNPNEYEVKCIDLENGEIVFVKVNDE